MDGVYIEELKEADESQMALGEGYRQGEPKFPKETVARYRFLDNNH
jgi:hypothetical protein